jgi:hypothetical protein
MTKLSGSAKPERVKIKICVRIVAWEELGIASFCSPEMG